MFRPALVLTLAAAALTGACGNSSPPPAGPAPVMEHGVFISAQDCADCGKLAPEICDKAVEMAITRHEADSPIYKTLRQCIAREGAERCDRMADGRYRPRLQAFYVALGKPASGVPLYPSQAGEVGFRSPSKQVISALDEGLTVSSSSVTLAYENAKLPAPQAGDPTAGVGEAAANIH
jgi:hypothetical protein